MSTQELQMILDALQKISGDAAGAAQWWIVAHYGVSYFSSALWFAGFTIVALTIGRTIRYVVDTVASTEKWANFGMRVARGLGAEGKPGSYERDQDRLSAALVDAAKKGGQA